MPCTLFRILCLALAFIPGVYGSAQANPAETHANRGLDLAQSGNLASAETELRRAVELAPGNPAFLADLGAVLAMEKKLEESTEVFRRALKLDPNEVTTRRYLAANLWQLHHYSEARQHLEMILKQKPGDPQALLLLGMVSENMKDYTAAVKALASVPALVGERPESIAALARSYYHVGQTEKARTTLAQLESHPAATQGIFLGAQIADEMQDYETAEKLLVSVQSTFPDQSALGYQLALIRYHAGRFEDGQKTLLSLVESGYKTGKIYNLLGWCYHQRKQFKEAAAALEQAISLEPTQDSNYLDLGKILLAEGSLPAALAATKRATETFPASPRALLLRGSVEMKMSQFNDAIGSYARAVELEPASPDGGLGLAEAQFAAGMTKEATASFETAIKRFPKDARFKVQYAVMLLKEAETGNGLAQAYAERLLKSALTLDSSIPEAHYQLGNLALQKGLAVEAILHLEMAVKLDPQSAETHFALARAYRRLGRKQEASKEMDLYQKLKDEQSQPGPEASTAGMSRN